MNCPCEAFGALSPVANWVAFAVFGLDPESHAGNAVRFFVFEVPRVLILLTCVVFVVGILRSFFTPARARRLLAGKRESAGNVLAALLGVATPFCSCSAVPLFIGFVTAGVPLGVTFSFLIAAPLVNEVALVLLFAMFGWQVAALYAGTGLAIAMAAGWILGRLRLEKWVEPWVYATPVSGTPADERLTWRAQVCYARAAVRQIVGKVWLYVVLGIALGAGIHGYMPADFLTACLGRSAWWSVPLAVLLGVPLYSNAAGVVPVMQALLDKGAALGTVLAFMMAVIGLSLPEAIILRKVLTLRLLLAFFGIVALGILIVGYVFNAVL